ncbi:hypothetical protein GQ55_9G442000 [Panicum hallii var. hallii]|uniref:Uncharacterized protein n=1 Tax=Panicum hallii var. hallii TaxID=1504633 RepID=A0A2T7CBF0_9POAL|nr:hypothetical protein GQ55_9G442000 [Panicum hallii var. hallii]
MPAGIRTCTNRVWRFNPPPSPTSPRLASAAPLAGAPAPPHHDHHPPLCRQPCSAPPRPPGVPAGYGGPLPNPPPTGRPRQPLAAAAAAADPTATGGDLSVPPTRRTAIFPRPSEPASTLPPNSPPWRLRLHFPAPFARVSGSIGRCARLEGQSGVLQGRDDCGRDHKRSEGSEELNTPKMWMRWLRFGQYVVCGLPEEDSGVLVAGIVGPFHCGSPPSRRPLKVTKWPCWLIR